MKILLRADLAQILHCYTSYLIVIVYEIRVFVTPWPHNRLFITKPIILVTRNLFYYCSNIQVYVAHELGFAQ